ncbi:MAG: exodeoxyribonuclease VII large subunit, partial [Kiritimatiellae bacterium]|nr:exodeoxyribonuclease VII large subunit [Kiritimatiellia bacterium]
MSEGKEQIKVYGVSELTDVIKGLFKRFDKIYVEGEISGWKVYASGHAYFTIKDENAQLSCVMFSSAIARCKAAPRLKDGAKVCIYGRIDVYAPRGTYQMVVLAAKIAGEGDLMARFNELKELLQKEGLFDRSRKRP